MQIDAFGHLLDINVPETIQCVVCRATAERLSSTWHGDGIDHHHYRCRSDTCPAGGTIVEHETGDRHCVGPVFGDRDLAVRLATQEHPDHLAEVHV